jgi:hypothetical protein
LTADPSIEIVCVGIVARVGGWSAEDP